MDQQHRRQLALDLSSLLGLTAPPLGILFSSASPEGVQPFDEPLATPTLGGRTGRVAAGCLFWFKGTERAFSTVAEDHANCSVGSVTHGFRTPAEVAGNEDLATLVESGWVTPEMFPQVAVVKERPEFVSYGPLGDLPEAPQVVFLRVSARQAMVLSDALPGDIRFEGKPQCHIVPLAKEVGEIALSVGCMLSRVRTGMSAGEMTCALPLSRLEEIVNKLRATCAADRQVAAYAADDARRFTGRAG